MGEKQNTTAIITVEGEEYEFDYTEFTARECRDLKKIGNIRGLGEVPAALQAGDLEVVVALAVIAMKRAGARPNAEKLLDAESGVIRIDFPDGDGKEEGDNPPS